MSDNVKQNASVSADRMIDRLTSEFGLIRAAHIIQILAVTQGAVNTAKLNTKEWAALIRELQNTLDDFNAFAFKN